MKKSRPPENDLPLVARHRARFEATDDETPLPFADARELFGAYVKLNKRLARIARISDNYLGEVKSLVLELQGALANVKRLRGLIPLCASCRRIRNDEGYWNDLEQYMAEYADVHFARALCPDCLSGLRTPVPAPIGEAAIRQLDQIDLDDPVVARFLPLVNDPAKVNDPLHEDFVALFRKYIRLSQRMRRIARISDGFQAQLQKLKSDFEESSRTDYLTGLSNRRDMYERLEAEHSRSLRHGKAFALAMADLDHFKDVNDAHGHKTGDRVLIAVAQVLREDRRKEDRCARWGGEEFLILLPETDVDGALAMCEKLRCEIAELSIEGENQPIRITASFGIAVYIQGESIRSCVERSDEALYQAKHEGRNRTVVHAAHSSKDAERDI